MIKKSWFPLTKGLKNYTKSFGIKIINKTEPLIQLNRTIDSVITIPSQTIDSVISHPL